MARISSSAALSLLNAAEALLEPPRPSDVVFMVRFLAQVTLPHSDPWPVPVWRRQNGTAMLTIYPFVTEAGEVRYPYASLPRLLLLWIVTEVVRTRQRRLELGDSLAGFMRRVGLSPGTRHSGTSSRRGQYGYCLVGQPSRYGGKPSLSTVKRYRRAMPDGVWAREVIHTNRR